MSRSNKEIKRLVSDAALIVAGMVLFVYGFVSKDPYVAFGGAVCFIVGLI